MTNQEAIAVKNALALKRQAFEYPRCGDGWPNCGREAQAEAILVAAGNPVVAPLSGEELAAVNKFSRSDAQLKAAAEAAYKAFHQARMAWKANRSSRQANQAMRQAEAAWKAAEAAVKSNIGGFGREMGVL